MFNQEYRTSDLYFAAYLQTAKCKLTGSEIDDNHKVTFIFEENPRIKDLLLGWTNRTEHVCALDYADNIKNLKAICFMTKEESRKNRK